MQKNNSSNQKIIQWKVSLNHSRYVVMKYVSLQEQIFTMADIYFNLKESENLQAKNVKQSLEWLANMGLIKRIIIKSDNGQKLMHYQSCYDYAFFLNRTEYLHETKSATYTCIGYTEKYKYYIAEIKEKILCYLDFYS